MCQTKVCTKCKEEKSIDGFGKSNRTKDGKQTQCRLCLKKQASENAVKRPPNIKPENGVKLCSKCKIEKHVDEFYLNPNLALGVHSECRTCSIKKVSVWHENNPEKVKSRVRKKKPAKIKPPKEILFEKVCSYCDKTKPITNFSGASLRCNSCLSDYSKNRACSITLTEKQCGSCKEIKPASDYNKDVNTVSGLCSRCSVCRKIEYERRKESMMFNNKIKHREKYKEDAFYRLVYNIRGRIRNSLNIYLKDGAKKSKFSEDIIGCTFEEFKAHIESQFLNWMSWENFGDSCGDSPSYNCSWDLDHIIPVSWATTNEELYSLNHWSNFQPLCSRVNRWEKKGNIYPCCNMELNLTVYV